MSVRTGIIAVVVLGLVITGYALTRTHYAPAPTASPTKAPGVHRSTPPPMPTGSQTPTPTPAGSTTPSVIPVPSPLPYSTPTPVPQTYTVQLVNYAFSPSTLTVNRGDTVVFQAVDAFYSVVVDGRSSGRLQPGQTWALNSADFAPGTYQMSDSTHATARGTLVIQ